MPSLIDKIYYLWKKCHRIETKLAAYQGYRQNSIIKWKQQTKLSWPVIYKLLVNFEIYTAPKVRNLIKKVVSDNKEIFSRNDCYITGFGNIGKSGDVILYDFTHTNLIDKSKIRKTWELTTLPENSTIIFVEDIIGTGTQSVKYIINNINQVINPSHQPILLSLCATPEGKRNVEESTNFQVITGILLTEEKYQHYSDKSKLFDRKEKSKIVELNNLLKTPFSSDYDKGLLLAFYFGIPNNTMPIFWKEGHKYKDKNGKPKEWYALLPRKF